MQAPVVPSQVSRPPLFPLRAYFPRHSVKQTVTRATAANARRQHQCVAKSGKQKSGCKRAQLSKRRKPCSKLSAKRADQVLEPDSSAETVQVGAVEGNSQDPSGRQASSAAAEQSGEGYDDQQASVSVSGSEDLDLDSIITGGQFDQSSSADQDWYSQLDRQGGNQQEADLASEPPREGNEAVADDDPDASYPARPYRSYALADLMEKAGIGLPEDFDEDQKEAIITGLQNKADKVKPGDLFICIPEPDVDVGEEVAEALQKEAAAIMTVEAFETDEDVEVPVMLVEDCLQAQQFLGAAFYDYPSKQMNVVAVTGSAGKTITSWLIRGIFDEQDKSAGLIGTVEYGIDEFLMTEEGDLWKRDEPDPTLTRESSTPNCLTVYSGKYEVPETMPDGLHLQKIMAGQAERKAKDCVIECTAAGLKEGRANQVDVNVAVFTNILKDKVDEFGGIEAYLRAQESLFNKLKDKETQCLVVNIDDPYADQIIQMVGNVAHITYSRKNEKADVFATKCTYNIWETVIEMNTPFGELKIITTLIGQNNVHNVLAAVAAGLAMSIPIKDIVAGIEATEVVPGRTEFIDLNQNFQVLVDSADTPDALLRLLDDVQRCGPRNILLVFGCEGDRDPSKRPYMGEIAYHKSNTLFITNQNQRTEPPEQIVRDIVAGFPDDILDRNASKPWKGGFLQDACRVSPTVRPFLLEGQNWYRKYIVEDRYTAIRWAIATAQQRDIVVVAGKGDQDWTEVTDGADGYIRGWLDDRVECRNALSKLYMLNGIRNMDRTEIPFESVGERDARWWEWGT